MIKIEFDFIIHHHHVGIGTAVVWSGIAVYLAFNHLGYPGNPFAVGIGAETLSTEGEVVHLGVPVLEEVGQEGPDFQAGCFLVNDVIFFAYTLDEPAHPFYGEVEEGIRDGLDAKAGFGYQPFGQSPT